MHKATGTSRYLVISITKDHRLVDLWAKRHTLAKRNRVTRARPEKIGARRKGVASPQIRLKWGEWQKRDKPVLQGTQTLSQDASRPCLQAEKNRTMS
jgi:hypothetical protein